MIKSERIGLVRRKLAGEEAELVLAPGEENFAGLDMRQAIEAHTAWIRRLNGVLAGHARTNALIA